MGINSASEVFTCRQYSERTLQDLHRDLSKNPQSRRRNTWEANRLADVKEEMERRGLMVERKWHD